MVTECNPLLIGGWGAMDLGEIYEVSNKQQQEIIRLGNLYEQHDRWGVIDTNGICGTLTAAMGMGGGHVIMILVKKKELLLWEQEQRTKK